MNALLDDFRPAFLDEVPSAPMAAEPTTVVLQAVGDAADVDAIMLTLTSMVDGRAFAETIRLPSLLALLADLLDGRTGELEIGGQPVAFEAGSDYVALPVGPLLVGGSIADWQKVVEREIAELVSPGKIDPEPSATWDGPSTEFSVLDSE